MPINLQSQAKEFQGDGEAQHVVRTNLQWQAQEFKGDGEVQHEVPTNLRVGGATFTLGDGRGAELRRGADVRAELLVTYEAQRTRIQEIVAMAVEVGRTCDLESGAAAQIADLLPESRELVQFLVENTGRRRCLLASVDRVIATFG